MPLDKGYLTGVFEGIEDAGGRIEKILKEYEADTTGLRVNKDAILKESKEYKDRLERLAQEREAEKSGLQKRIEELEAQVKHSGPDEAKNIRDAELKRAQEMHAAKLAESEKAIGQHKAAYEELNARYQQVLKDTELDKAMDRHGNLDPVMKPSLRDVFWRRNLFEFQNVEGEEKLLNKDYRNIADTLTAFLGTDEGKRYILSNSTGGGAAGSSSAKPSIGNPFLKGKENLDEQARILKENPAQFAQLKAQAGAAAKGG